MNGSSLRHACSTLSIALTLSLTACGGGDADSDSVIEDGGLFVDGWNARFDSATATEKDVRLTAEGDALRVEVGPNVVLWSDQHRADGRYTVSAEVEHLNSHGHHHGAGLVFGGRDVDGAGQAYTYFLVHGGGKFLIKRRDGDETTPVVPYTAHDAVGTDAADGVARNRLAVEVGAETTRFLVNDVEVHRAPNAELHTDGRIGFRLVHNLDVRLQGLRVQTGE